MASGRLQANSTGADFRFEIAGARHLNFTDYGAYYIPGPLHGLTQLGSINGGRCLTVVSAHANAFANHVFGAGPDPRMDRHYPEVHPAR